RVTPPSPRSYTATALAYARAVVAGDVLACRWVRLACERHLRDLERAKSDPSFRYRFDRTKAERVCRFAELLPHVKGKWAAGTRGDPTSRLIRLEPWQVFILCSLFGWIHR